MAPNKYPDGNEHPTVENLSEERITSFIASLETRGYFQVVLQKNPEHSQAEFVTFAKEYFASLMEDALNGEHVTVNVLPCSDPETLQVICRKSAIG